MALFLIGESAKQLIAQVSKRDATHEVVQAAVKLHDPDNQKVEGIYVDEIDGVEHFVVYAIYANNGDFFSEAYRNASDALKWLEDDSDGAHQTDKQD